MSKLSVIATPIGNLEDITYRAVRILGEVEALACEDTRVTRKIYERYGISTPDQMFACNDHNEARSAQGIVKLLDEGKHVGLVSDAGMPGVNDPGFRVVQAALDAAHDVEVIPGPSAVPTALVLSGLTGSSFVYLGFPSKKSGKRKKLLEENSTQEHTLVLFESPYRIGKLLADAFEVLGDRQAAVTLELTKLHERADRGYLSDLAAKYDGVQPKGEITVVIAGNNPKFFRGYNDGEEG